MYTWKRKKILRYIIVRRYNFIFLKYTQTHGKGLKNLRNDEMFLTHLRPQKKEEMKMFVLYE